MNNFFIDTANLDEIDEVIDFLGNEHIDKCVGVTTNPNAMAKIDAHYLPQWKKAVYKISDRLAEAKGNTDGEVHFQVPNSLAHPEILNKYLDYMLDNRGPFSFAVKISPNISMLAHAKEIEDIYGIKTNVTGLADSETALYCMNYGVDYVSIIPGRMEERGINANSHLSYLHIDRYRRDEENKHSSDVITGSMRTIEGVKNAILYGTIPTIGYKVWKLIMESEENIFDNNLKELNEYTGKPRFTRDSINLSKEFFEQMDHLGKNAFADLASFALENYV